MNRLALVVHFHQPVGNLDMVVARATERCYRPFLETLAAHPGVPMTLHYSGCLLEWLEANETDVTDLLRTLVDRGQVELMTGGFYEPILAALPQRDQLGQITMLTRHLAESYEADATGLWLTERVWEQDVIPAIVDAGVRYTVIDDTIFHSVGVPDEELTGPFVTEHGGKPLLVYAGDRHLRYLIPYKRLERVFEHIRAGADRLFVYADDGEKFGEWPDTHERVYAKKWLERFLTGLESSDDIELTTLGLDALEARPRGRVYLPSASYDEMMTWALPARARLIVGKARRRLEREDREGLLPFVRGAPWRAFLAKYPEVNHLQKRMVAISEELHRAGAPVEAIRELYRAQCNCSYWHGAFGGVYFAYMRAALWHHLMRAEAALQREPGLTVADIDADIRDEILLTAPWGAAVIDPDDARLIELDDWSFGANLLAVAARHEEAYHLEDENPPDEEAGDSFDDDAVDDEMPALQARAEVDRDSLMFDEAPLGALIDLIDGRRLEGYECSIESDSAVFITRRGDSLEIRKEITADEDGLRCTHTLTNIARRGARGGNKTFRFESETSALPLSLGRGTVAGELEVTPTGWRLEQPDGEVGIEVTCEPAGDVTSRSIETASATLEGLATMRQGTTVTTTWELLIPPRGSRTIVQVLRPIVSPTATHKPDRGVSA